MDNIDYAPLQYNSPRPVSWTSGPQTSKVRPEIGYLLLGQYYSSTGIKYSHCTQCNVTSFALLLPFFFAFAVSVTSVASDTDGVSALWRRSSTICVFLGLWDQTWTPTISNVHRVSDTRSMVLSCKNWPYTQNDHISEIKFSFNNSISVEQIKTTF